MDNLAQLIKQIEQLSPQNQAAVIKYVEFLQWQEQQSRLPQSKSWSLSFIEAFKNAAVSASDDPAGMDVKLAPATVGGQSRPALWAHPPVVGKAVIEYHVPIPQQVSNLRLALAVGIRDGAKIAATNLVAFGVKVNGVRLWGQQTNEHTWQEVEIPLNVSTGDIVRFEFTTEALDRHEWTWAVWGKPELSGVFNG